MKPRVVKVKRKLKINKTYRTIKRGEKIRRGDEIGNGAGDWWPCGDIGQKSTGMALLRRPLKKRKSLSKKQVKKNRDKGEQEKRELEAVVNREYSENCVEPPKEWSAGIECRHKPEDTEPDLQSQLNEIQTGEPALDIKVGFGIHDNVMHDCSGGFIFDTDKALQSDFESSKKRLGEQEEIDSQRELASEPPKDSGETWTLSDGTKLKWNQESGRYEEVSENRSNFIVAAIVVFCLMTIAYYSGKILNPHIEYRDKIKIEYSRPMELKGIPDNPWRKAIPILPEDIKITRDGEKTA